MYAAIGGNNVPRAIDASDFFVATPTSPSHGEFNPWYASLDRSRLGIVGHSGAAGVALTVGHSDSRFDAIAWDPAGSYSRSDVTPRIPTMVQVADYRQETVPPPRHEEPVPALPKFTFFDTISAAGVDAMQISPRASTHFEWARGTLPGGEPYPFSIYGEMAATYYTLAWFDRYLAPARGRGALVLSHSLPIHDEATRGFVAKPRQKPDWLKAYLSKRDALRRLTATGTRCFDRSADVSSIGSGFFDARKADRAGSIEAGSPDQDGWAAHPKPPLVPVRLPILPQRRRAAMCEHAGRLFVSTPQ